MYDAHVHLADPIFDNDIDGLLSTLRTAGWKSLVVNGTRESDWPDVAALHQKASDILLPSYGLHPWFVRERSADWLDRLKSLIRAQPIAGVGECGLDRWIEGHDLAEQLEVLRPQIELAAQYNRPLTIHCLKAWGPLLECLSKCQLKCQLPDRGFLVHASSASQETADRLLKLGARFSYSTYFVHDRKAKVRDVYAQLPLDRILVETDAPSMPPPIELNRSPWADKSSNHPLNLPVAIESLIQIREESAIEVVTQLERNFVQFFGGL